MQKIERVEGQELNTTEQRTEVYTDSIQESIANYCIDHDLEIKDIYTFDQQRWNSVLLYIYKQVFNYEHYRRGYPPLAQTEWMVRCWLSLPGPQGWIHLQTPARVGGGGSCQRQQFRQYRNLL